MARKDNSPVSIRIRLRYPDLDTFIEKYAANVSQGGMFIQSRAPQPAGTLLRFEVLLADGSRLLKGEGRVIWVREYDAANPTQVHGMGVKFTDLDEQSLAVVARVLAYKEAQGSDPGHVRPVRKGTITQEVRALAREALTTDEEEIEEEQPSEDDIMVFDRPSSETEEGYEGEEDEPASVEAQQGVGDEVSQDEDPVVAEPSVGEPSVAQVLRDVAPEIRAVFDSGGDGVDVALASAERLLQELVVDSGISEEMIDAQLASVIAEPPPDEMQELLSSAPQTETSFDQAMETLHRTLGGAIIAPVAPVPKRTPPKRKIEAPLGEQPEQYMVAGTDVPMEADLDIPEEEHFDPTLLEAAASVSRHKPKASQSFDLSEEPEQSAADIFNAAQPESSGEEQPAETPEGWQQLATVTELLDHDSSGILKEMAQQVPKADGSDLPPAPRVRADLSENELEEAVTIPIQKVEAEDEAADVLSSEVMHEVIGDLAGEIEGGAPVEEEMALFPDDHPEDHPDEHEPLSEQEGYAAPPVDEGYVAPPEHHPEGYAPPEHHPDGYAPPEHHPEGYAPPEHHPEGYAPPEHHPDGYTGDEGYAAYPGDEGHAGAAEQEGYVVSPEQVEHLVEGTGAPEHAPGGYDMPPEHTEAYGDHPEGYAATPEHHHPGEYASADQQGYTAPEQQEYAAPSEHPPEGYAASPGQDYAAPPDDGSYSDPGSYEDFAEYGEDQTEVSSVPQFDPNAEADLLPGDDIFPGDPDLDDEIFDALAQLGDGEKQPPPSSAPPAAEMPIRPEESVPSLDMLASKIPPPQEPPQESESPPGDLDNLRIVADDPSTPAPEDKKSKSIRPRKSGIFRRLFSKKKEGE